MDDLDYEENVILSGTEGGIEVTPEMIQAGFQVLSSSGIKDDYQGADKLLVSRIYRSMRAIAQNSVDRRRSRR